MQTNNFFLNNSNDPFATNVTKDIFLEQKRIKVTIVTTYICIALCLIFSTLYWFREIVELAYIFVVFLFVYLSALFLIKNNNIKIAKPVLFFGVLFHTFMLSVFIGKFFDVRALYIPILIIPFLIYNIKENWMVHISVLVSLVVILLVYNVKHLPNFTKSYDIIIYNEIHYTLNIICIICMIVLSYLFQYVTNFSENELKEINEKLISSENELIKANQLKDQLIQIIAHDVRSPLASVQGVVELLKNDQLDKKDLELIADRFQKTANYTNNMLEELLEWTNSQSNKFEQHIIEFDLHSLAEKLFKNYQIKAEEKNLSLIYEGPNEIYIKSDPQLLEVVIRNLLTNAIKFSFPNNTIKIAIEKNPTKNHLLMHVIDNGVGIDQSKMTILFDSDVNKIKRGTFNEKGTGVGLLICKNLCNVLGVQIFAQSIPLVETRFTLKISTENSQPTNR